MSQALDESGGPVISEVLSARDLLPEGYVGVDVGMTLTKVARVTDAGVVFEARAGLPEVGRIDGITGAGARLVPHRAFEMQEILAAAKGAGALLRCADDAANGEFLLALLGTGTAFAAVRGESVTHLGGTPLGGGSFAGIARRVDATLGYGEMIERAARGERRRVDTMIADVYPEGIGRVSADLTAAHLSKANGGSLDDFLAGLLNLHGENIAQIAAGRALTAKLSRIVLAGGFAHGSAGLVESIRAMASLFGMQVAIVPHPAFAGALGVALAAAEARERE